MFLALVTAGARAQVSDNMSVKIDDETPENSQNIIYLNAKQCGVGDDDANVEIEVSLRMLPSATFLEVWTDRGAGGNNCNTADARSPQTSTGRPACNQIEDAAVMNPVSVGTQTVKLRARDLFGDGDEAGCSSSTQKIYFVPLNNRTTEAATGNSESLSTSPIVLTLTIDVDAPAAVSSIKPSDGETQIGASWNQSAETRFLDYRLYFDPNGISKRGAPCESDKLKKGVVVADDADLEWTNGQGTEASRDPDSLGMSIGEQIPVAVAVRDLARNESVLSEVVCASYIDTEGFLDRYKKQGGDGLSTCAAYPGKPKGPTSLAALFLLALGLMARRRLS
jgi:uncharacterized protein (TIGR03382 family)